MASEWDDEFSNLDDRELDSSNDTDGDEDFDVEKLSKSERKRYEKMKADIESKVVEALAKDDQNTPFYKGLQRELAKRDTTNQQLRTVVKEMADRLANVEGKDGEADFMFNIINDMLDEDGKKALAARKDQFQSHRDNKRNETLLKQLLREREEGNRVQQTWPAYGQMEDPPEIVQYKKEAEQKLRAFAKRMGADPNSKELDYGDSADSLLVRMGKLESSIERAIDKQDDKTIDSVRDTGNKTQTRTDTSPRTQSAGNDGISLLERAANKKVEEMRKLKR